MKKLRITFIFLLFFGVNLISEAQLIPDVPRGIRLPRMSDKTMDEAYDAPSKSLVGTWVESDSKTEICFKADGSAWIKTYAEDSNVFAGVVYGTQVTGTWKKKGNDLKILFRPANTKYLYDKEAYANLSTRLKKEFDSAIARGMKTIRSLSGTDDVSYYIVYIDDKFICLREEIVMGYYIYHWFVNEKYLEQFK